MLDPLKTLYQDANGTWRMPVTDAIRHQWAVNTAEYTGVPYSLFGGNIIGTRTTRNVDGDAVDLFVSF